MKQKAYGPLSLGVGVEVHQESAKPTNLVDFLMGFLTWQEILSLALVPSSSAERH